MDDGSQADRPGEPAGPTGPPAHRPLVSHLVVDLSRHLPGPLVSRLLGDLGARVIKVEEPRLGDPTRHLPAQQHRRRGLAPLATVLLAGHESVALDLGKDAAREVLDALLARADVLVESFRPGTLARFGLAPETLRRRFPRLIVCSVSGFGQTGPHAGRAGHDLSYQALAGALAPTAAIPAVPVADIAGGLSAAAAVLAALVRRGGDGAGGCHIDAALLDAAGFANLTSWALGGSGEGGIGGVGVGGGVGERGPLTGALAGYGVYPTADEGFVALAALEPHFWKRLCHALERPAWVRRQADGSAAFRAEVAAVIAGRSRAEWAALFAEHDLPAEPVLSAAEARAHPQVENRGLLSPADGGIPRLGFPALFDGARPRSGPAAPALGADTEAVLDELGLGKAAGRRRLPGVGRRPSLRRWLANLLRRR